MSRYIDVDALGIGKANPDIFIREEYASGWNLAIEIIENAPTADVVEVVRCRDCKYWDKVKNPKHAGKRICISPNKSIGGYCTRKGATLENDYCSLGTRMDGDEK